MDVKQDEKKAGLEYNKKTKVNNLENYLKYLFPTLLSVAEIFRQQKGDNGTQDFAGIVNSFLPKAKVERVTDQSVLVTFPNGETLFFTVQNNGSIVVLSRSDMNRRKIKNKFHLNDLLKHYSQSHETCLRCARFYDQSESKTVLVHDFDCSSQHTKKHRGLCEICAELSNVSFHDQVNKSRCLCCDRLFYQYELINRSDPDRSGLCFLPEQMCVTLGYVTAFEIPNNICLRCSVDQKNL